MKHVDFKAKIQLSGVLPEADNSCVGHGISQTQNSAAHNCIHQVKHRGSERCSRRSTLHRSLHRKKNKRVEGEIWRVLGGIRDDGCDETTLQWHAGDQGMEMGMGWEGGVCAAGCWTAAWAQDKGSCPNCLTSLIGDILDRTSGNSGVSVTTSSDWPVGHAIAFTRLLYWKTESTPWLPHGCKYSQVALVLQTQQIKLQGSQNIKNGSPKHIVIN